MVIYQIPISQTLNIAYQNILLFWGLAVLSLLAGASCILPYLKLKKMKNKDQIKRSNQWWYLSRIIFCIVMAMMSFYISNLDVKDYMCLNDEDLSKYTGELTDIVRFSGDIFNEVPLDQKGRIHNGMYRLEVPGINETLKIETDDYLPFQSTGRYNIYYLPGSGKVIKVVELNSETE